MENRNDNYEIREEKDVTVKVNKADYTEGGSAQAQKVAEEFYNYATEVESKWDKGVAVKYRKLKDILLDTQLPYKGFTAMVELEKEFEEYRKMFNVWFDTFARCRYQQMFRGYFNEVTQGYHPCDARKADPNKTKEELREDYLSCGLMHEATKKPSFSERVLTTNKHENKKGEWKPFGELNSDQIINYGDEQL